MEAIAARVGTVLAGLLVAVVAAEPLAGAAPGGWAPPDSLEGKVDAYLSPYVEMGLFSGSVLIAVADEALLRKGYGMADYEHAVPNTPQTRFPIGSITKDFTWLTLIQLKERGHLQYQDPIATYVPDWPNGDRITINHLANYRAGLPVLEKMPGYHEKEKRTWAFRELLDMFRNEPLISEPGGPEHYGSTSYILLAHVIEAVTGHSYVQHLRDYIFDPCEMHATGESTQAAIIPGRARGYMPDLDGEGLMNAPFVDLSIKYGSGSLYSSVDDLHRFRRTLMANRLSREVAGAHIFRPKQRNNRLVAEHVGSSPGYTSMVREYLHMRLTIIVLGNNYAQVHRQIVDGLSNLLLGEEYEVPRVRTACSANLVDLEEALGEYRFEFDETGRVEKRGGHFVLSFDGGRDTPLIPQEKDEFFLPLWWATLRFERDSDGAISRALWTEIGTGKVALGERLISKAGSPSSP